ncbi:hypothetical protein [Metabacillus schmidteae]|uniref:hypothetical protein n=1 Tax=Metabacillus schmidteae TaxID=2730405 RepID=UPI00158BEAC6|nr:hypothetical protein [Metabacillus schmidteae]
MENPNIITIETPVVKDGNKILCKFKCIGEVNKYFNTNTFYLEVNEIVDSVPISILNIPILANICPIAWITGSDIYIDQIDKNFQESLKKVKASFQSLYPQHTFRGEIYHQEIVSNQDYESQASGLFFSGGVDSVTSFIRKRHESPYLMTVLGADIPESDIKGCSKVEKNIMEFALEHHLVPVFIKSNLRTFLNERKLNKNFSKSGLSNWWGSIQHGLGMVGLSAPLTYLKGINTIYFATSPGIFSVESCLDSSPWGSHPSIENNLKWGKTKTELEGMELNRFDKITIIADFLRNYDSSIKLRVCWESTSGDNCGNCEKCARTMAALLLEGLNPSDLGFNTYNPSIHSLLRNEQFFSKLNDNKELQWKFIKKRLSNTIFEENFEFFHFLQWILQTDFKRKKD